MSICEMDGPITAEVCKRFGGIEADFAGGWYFSQSGRPLVAWASGRDYVDMGPIYLRTVNTAARLYHLLKALGFEVGNE